MTEINVKTKQDYQVIIGRGILDCGKRIFELFPKAQKALICCDNNTFAYAKTVAESLEKFKKHAIIFQLEPGEINKNFAVYQSIIEAAAENFITRNDIFVAVGGGVVSDIMGFAAATYMRGVPFVTVTTTLLGGIDASIGGKTAINLENGKNMVGSFYQPSLVLFDLNALKTLPKSEFLNGMGEGIKYAILMGGKALQLALDGITEANIEEFASLCVDYKAKIVKNDEFDLGQRKTLNLGHTLAHALEKSSNYTIKHGIAVASGIISVAKASNKNGKLSDESLAVIYALMKKYGFEEIPITKNVLIEAFHDKKYTFNQFDFIDILELSDVQITKLNFEQLGEYVL